MSMNTPFNFSGESFVFPDQVSFDFSATSQQPSYPPLQQHPPQPPPQSINYQPYTIIDPLLVPSQPPPPFYYPEAAPSPSTGLRIKLPPMAPSTRGVAREQPSISPVASGSEYHESNASVEAEEDNPKQEEEDAEDAADAKGSQPVQFRVSSRGRLVAKKSYAESASEDDDDDPIDLLADKGKAKAKAKGKGKQLVQDTDDEDEEADTGGRYALRHTRSRGLPNKLNGFIVSDEEDGTQVSRLTRSRSKINGQTNGGGGRITRQTNGRSQPQASSSRATRNSRLSRRTRSTARVDEDEDGYVDEPASSSNDGEASLDDAPATSPEPEADPDADADADGEADGEGDADPEPEQDGKPYALRQRTKINYAIPPPLEEMRPPPKPRSGGNKSHGRSSNRPKAPGWSATGAELSRWMGGGGDDSVSRTCHMR